MKKELHKEKLSTVSGGETMPLVDALNKAYNAKKSKEELEQIVLNYTLEALLNSTGTVVHDFISVYDIGIAFIESKFGPYEIKPSFKPPVSK